MRFLVDVNLPKKFSYFNSDDFIHVSDIDPRMKDGEIWDYAKTNKLIILTKDADFYHKNFLDDSGQKVVYFKLGNKKLSELHEYFSHFWETILENLIDARLIVAYSDSIKILK